MIKLSAVAKAKINDLKSPNLIGDWPMESLGPVDVVNRLSNFYILADLSLDHSDLVPIWRDYGRELAENFINYIVFASMGECRYTTTKTIRSDGRRWTETKKEAVAKGILRDEGSLVLRIIGRTKSSSSRYKVWEKTVNALEFFPKEVLLEGCRQLFSLPWEPSYGGGSWARIAEVGLNYLAGNITPNMLVDILVDIIHNGGWALNKYYVDRHYCSKHALGLDELIDLKVMDAKALIPFTCLHPAVESVV
jgi:hypothetical protein